MKITVQRYLGLITDVVFFVVGLSMLLYISRDLMGLPFVNQRTGVMLFNGVLVGAPLSLLLSIISVLAIQAARFKWYVLFSVAETVLLALIAYVLLGGF